MFVVQLFINKDSLRHTTLLWTSGILLRTRGTPLEATPPHTLSTKGWLTSSNGELLFFLYNSRVLNAWKRYFHHSLCPSARLRLHSTHRRTYRNNALVKILKCGKYYQICCGYSARVSSGGCRLPLLLSHHNVLATGSLGGTNVLHMVNVCSGSFLTFFQIIQ